MASPFRIANALTIDVEDYFQVSAFASHFPRSDWDGVPCRIQRNVDRILEILAKSGTKATFFTLGWIAERYPRLVQSIVAQGHELASHGYEHHRATELGRKEFRDDIHRAKCLLEDISGVTVKGYRAPSFSVGATNLWAFDALLEVGYQYSSSVYPIRHDHYGMPDAPRFAYHPLNGLLEIPVTTARFFNANVPAGGGGYFRLMPYLLSRWLLKRVNSRDRQPAIFYFHPWELDPEQPRVSGAKLRTRFRHYVNLDKVDNRLQRLLIDFNWDRVDRIYLESADAQRKH
jgi:polysaccharide deacetylase family protein (PEP-CTERM system associated)